MDQTQRQTTLQWLVALSLLLLLVGYLVQVMSFWQYTNDDAYITFRYSRYLAMGWGPYYNPGEYVEGYTNFSLMLLVSAYIACFGAKTAPVASKVLGVCCGVGCVLLSFSLTRRLLRQHEATRAHAGLFGLVSAGLLSMHPGFLINGTSGLETMLFGFSLIAGLHQLAKELEARRWAGSALWFGLAILTRPEGIYIFAAAWLGSAAMVGWLALSEAPDDTSKARAIWIGGGKLWFVQGLLASAVYLGHIGLRMWLYQGEWLPNTYYAKSGGFWGLGASTYIKQALNPSIGGIVGALVAAAGLLMMLRQKPRVMGLLLVVIASVGLPLITGTDWMMGWRLLVPFLPFVFACVVVGWAYALSAVSRHVAVAVGLLLLMLPWAWFGHAGMRRTFLQRATLRHRGYQTGHKALADWLCKGSERARKNDAIVVMDIGIIGYRCIEQTIIDITGLTDRVIAKRPGPFLRKRIDPNYILRRNPRYVVFVMAARGNAYQIPAAGTRFRFWTQMEHSLFFHPRFQKQYVRSAQALSPGDLTAVYPFDPTWRERFAKKLGALKIFEHGHPGMNYLLVVFARKPTKAASPAAPKHPMRATPRAAPKHPARATPRAAPTPPARGTPPAAPKRPTRAMPRVAPRRPTGAATGTVPRRPTKAAPGATPRRPTRAAPGVAPKSP